MIFQKITRLARSFGIIALNAARLLYAPSKAREFFAYVYLYSPVPYSAKIREVTWKELFSDPFGRPISLKRCVLDYGNLSYTEVMTICLLVQELKPKTIFEFGTFNGVTTLQMAMNSAENCRIHTLNLPPSGIDTAMALGEYSRDKLLHPAFAGTTTVFDAQPEAAKIEQLWGDSATFDFTKFEKKVDLVFIDACHEYDYVKCDTESALKMIADSGGIILWHDFPNAPGVMKYLEEISGRFDIRHIKDTRLAIARVPRS